MRLEDTQNVSQLSLMKYPRSYYLSHCSKGLCCFLMHFVTPTEKALEDFFLQKNVSNTMDCLFFVISFPSQSSAWNCRIQDGDSINPVSLSGWVVKWNEMKKNNCHTFHSNPDVTAVMEWRMQKGVRFICIFILSTRFFSPKHCF